MLALLDFFNKYVVPGHQEEEFQIHFPTIVDCRSFDRSWVEMVPRVSSVCEIRERVHWSRHPAPFL